MKNIFKLLVLIVSLNSASLSLAHPPQSVELIYDNNNTTLRIDIKHLSRDSINHYIERIEVVKNNDAPIVKHFRQQINPNTFFYDLTITAAVSDQFNVTVYSREGGTAETELEITQELLDLEIPRREPPSRGKRTTPTDSTKIKPAILTSSSQSSKAAVPNNPKIQKPAVTRDKDLTGPGSPKKGIQLKNAVPSSSNVVKPAVTTNPITAKPAQP